MNEKIDKFEKSVKVRKFLLELSFVAIIALVVIISLNGGGDSRIIPANILSWGSSALIISLVYIIYRISVYAKLLKDKNELRKYMAKTEDETRRYIHEKSGGEVWTIAFVASVLIAFISAEYDVKAFWAAYAMFVVLVAVKLVFYFYYRSIAEKK